VTISTELSFCLISLGCFKNQVDSEMIIGEMISAGFTYAESSDDADIIIVNTCGFITPAKEESIEVILDAIDQGESAKVAVCGCLTQRYHEQIKSEIPEIDFLYGLPDENFVKELCAELKISIAGEIIRKREPIIDGLPYSYIKIAEGCSNNCSYCAIPLIRGPHKSFSVESILLDSTEAVKKGAKELIIIAQDITAYSYEGVDLVGLTEKISQIDGVNWIRLLYAYPDHIDEKLINFIRDNKKIVKYIDMPFQHVSRHILASMGRKGDFDTYYELAMKLRESIPGVRIRSTFMVGYPGETESDFDLLIEFLKKTRLDRIGGFIYSPEEDTRAADMDSQVPEKIKNERFDMFMKVQQEISSSVMEDMIGKDVEVLIEEKYDESTYIGRTEYDAPEVDGVFYLTSKNEKINSIVKARVTGAVEYDLIGEPV